MKNTIKKKMGRPKIENPKNKVICFRLTEFDMDLLSTMAKSVGKSKSLFCEELFKIIFINYLKTKKNGNKKQNQN